MKISKTLPESKFTSYFLETNDISLDSFQKWYFQSGMSFQDSIFWWENNKHRKRPHEGIDLYYYTNNTGNIIKLDNTNKFSLLFSGRIVQMFDDFQGKTLHVVHDIYGDKHNRLHSLYGHIKLLRVAVPGDCINENSAIVSILANTKNKVPPHLHLTVFWAPIYMAETVVNWDSISLIEEIQLIDPTLIL